MDEPEVDPVFRDYLAYLVSQGLLTYLRRSATRPTVKIPDTSYWWGKDLTGYFKFVWHGPDAYSGLLPSPYKELYPEWESVKLFATIYQRRLDAVDWSTAKLAAYNITPEWSAKMDQVKNLCDNNKWAEAMALYKEIENE